MAASSRKGITDMRRPGWATSTSRTGSPSRAGAFDGVGTSGVGRAAGCRLEPPALRGFVGLDGALRRPRAFRGSIVSLVTRADRRDRNHWLGANVVARCDRRFRSTDVDRADLQTIGVRVRPRPPTTNPFGGRRSTASTEIPTLPGARSSVGVPGNDVVAQPGDWNPHAVCSRKSGRFSTNSRMSFIS